MIPSSPRLPLLKPKDAEVSLRSLGPRYRDLLDRVPMDRQHELEERTGPDGVTPLSLLTSVAHDLGELETALRDVLHRDDVRFAMDPLAHDPSDEPYLGVAVALERVEARTAALAELASQTNRSLNDWQRTGLVQDAESITAWDIAQDAVAIATHRLRLMEAIVTRI